MLWVFLSTNGSAATGSQEFPTKDACVAAVAQLEQMVVAAAGMAGTPMLAPMTRCIERATGKP